MSERLATGEIGTRNVTIAFLQTTLNGAARLMRDNHVADAQLVSLISINADVEVS